MNIEHFKKYDNSLSRENFSMNKDYLNTQFANYQSKPATRIGTDGNDTSHASFKLHEFDSTKVIRKMETPYNTGGKLQNFEGASKFNICIIANCL